MSLESESRAAKARAEKATAAKQKTMAAAYKSAYTKAVGELEKLWALGEGKSTKAKAMLGAIKDIQKLYTKVGGAALDTTKAATIESYILADTGTEYAIGKTLGVNLGFGQVSDNAIASDEKGGTVDIIKTFRKNTAKIQAKIRNTIVKNLVLGRTIEQVAEEIKADFNNGYNDAIRVMRTETHRAYSEGQLDAIEGAQELGIEIVKVWKSFGGARDSHEDMDNVEADENGMFELVSGDNEGATAEGPGMFNIPEEDIQCRCTILEKIVDKPESMPGQPMEYPSYAEWMSQFHPGNS